MERLSSALDFALLSDLSSTGGMSGGFGGMLSRESVASGGGGGGGQHGYGSPSRPELKLVKVNDCIILI